MNNLINNKDLVERILDKLEEITKEITELKVVSVKQEENLKVHMKRSDALEEQLDIMRQELKPVQKHVFYVDAFIKGLGLISIIIGIISGLLKIQSLLL